MAETVLEELGHAYNIAAGAGGSTIVADNPLTLLPSYKIDGYTVSAGMYNFMQIMKNCNK